MQNITIGRYKPSEGTITRVHHDSDGVEISREVVNAYAGWIEGVRDDGSRWIMFLDADGNPSSYFGQREPDGAVIGEPVILDADSPAVAAYL
ncbi:hypothetical protein [Nocardia farcinica]|nr:hypothetical protein [Nocardia farcinica]